MKKSMAARASRWFLRKVSQRWLESRGEPGSGRPWTRRCRSPISRARRGSGSTPGRILRCHGADQVAKLVRDSRSAGRCRERRRQYQRNPARCQPTTVSGFTTISTLAYLDQQRRKPSQKRRSHGFNFGLGFLRLRTPTCCRKATSSSPKSCREQKKAPNQERKARRSRVMGPVYVTQSTGSQVPASC